LKGHKWKSLINPSLDVKILVCGRQAEFKWNKKSKSKKRELKFELAFGL
jgi:hypothetical protein